MSRVGKMPVTVPQGVDVSITAEQISVKGGNGTLARALNSLVGIKKDGATLVFDIELLEIVKPEAESAAGAAPKAR